MKATITLSALALLTASLVSAQAAAKEDITKAIKQLADSGGYSWKATMESSQFNPAPTTGKINKEGIAMVTRSFGGNTMRTVHQGEKSAMETEEGWRSLAELESDQGGDNRGRFMAMMLRNYQPPTKEAEDLLKNAGDLTLKDGAYSATLSEAGVKEMLSFRRRGAAQGQGPEISGASGTVRFWVEKGALVKYQYSVKGKMSFNNNEREIDRTTTVEFSDVGKTEVQVPDEAKKKLS